MKDSKVIIIKKVTKGRHSEGSHGGAWKVAYADFVTALMAFFLLMWLITMVSPEKRARVAAYFKHFTIFQESGESFMQKSSQVFDEAGESAKRVPNEVIGTYNVNTGEFKMMIGKAIEEKLNDIKDQIMVNVFDGGIRIELMDQDGNPMFDSGSPRPTALGKRVLAVIGQSIAHIPNNVAIEGHTDSAVYKKVNYSNWDLSTGRALSAQKELEKNGLDPGHIAKVAGYADTALLIKDDPKDSRNRRISVILLFPKI